jgi:hypothetical protein
LSHDKPCPIYFRYRQGGGILLELASNVNR